MNSSNEEKPMTFNKEVASSYDKQLSKLSPMKGALHLCMRMVLSDLPSDANILCVGVGTGAELVALAQMFPEWHFTAVEPAAPMLNVFRQRAEELGIAARCTFHEGYVSTLPKTKLFDAATSILVSQFLTEPNERRDFFREIGDRLHPNGYLVNADLAWDMSAPNFQDLFDVWLRMLAYSAMPADKIEEYRTSFGKDVAVLPQQEVEELIVTSGFDAPILFCQTLFIHAWYSKLMS